MTTAIHKCPECEGQGWREYERACRASASNPYGDIEAYFAECDNCEGSGEVEVETEDLTYDHDEYGDWLYHQAKDRELDEQA